MATTYSLSCGNGCKEYSHDINQGMPISPRMPCIFDPSTIPNMSSSIADVLHFRPCMGITSIYTNPETHIERHLMYDTMVIAIAGAVHARQARQPPAHAVANKMQSVTTSCIRRLHGQRSRYWQCKFSDRLFPIMCG